jgi:hypothetical protein
MTEPVVVKTNISTEAGFTEAQATALRQVFSDYYDELEELRDKLEYLEGELEVR